MVEKYLNLEARKICMFKTIKHNIKQKISNIIRRVNSNSNLTDDLLINESFMDGKRGYRVNNELSLSELSDVTTC